MPWVPTIFI